MSVCVCVFVSVFVPDESVGMSDTVCFAADAEVEDEGKWSLRVVKMREDVAKIVEYERLW